MRKTMPVQAGKRYAFSGMAKFQVKYETGTKDSSAA